METILVVDDNREIVDSLGKLLAIEGYEILTACDGMEALDKMESAKVDLILLDVMLGGISGYRMANKVRNELKLKTPIIFLTAKDTENDMLTGFSAGGDDGKYQFLYKVNSQVASM